MKKLIIAFVLFSTALNFNANAQETTASEGFGNTLNLGIGIGGYSGYYRYVGHSLPVFNINYELQVANNFTLAPTLSIYTYSNNYYYKNNYYGYHETVIPIGVKGSYYFDNLVNASPNWDFYLAGSLGFAVVNSRWDANYYGDKKYFHNPNPVFFDIHIGTEYHFNSKIGAFLDLSSGISTIGLAIH